MRILILLSVILSSSCFAQTEVIKDDYLRQKVFDVFKKAIALNEEYKASIANDTLDTQQNKRDVLEEYYEAVLLPTMDSCSALLLPLRIIEFERLTISYPA
jgi:hypothetical protein